MVTAQKITSNTTWYLLALVVQKLLSFVYFTLLARHLGPAAYGQYQLSLNFAMMLSVVADLGLSAVLIREIAKQKFDDKQLFRQTFTLKLILSLVTALAIIILDLLLFAQDAVRPLIYVTTLIVMIDSFTLLFYGYIRGQQNLRFESIGTMLFQLIIMVLGLSVMRVNTQVWPFILVILAASVFNLVYSAILLFHKYQVKLALVFDKVLVKQIFLITWPFALSAVFAKVYAYVDSVILKLVQGSVEVGLYSVAYKITFAFQFIPLAFVAALYPAFAHYWQHDKTQLEKTLLKAMHYLAFIALPLAFGIMGLATVIIHRLYTASYSGSILSLEILIASLPFLFVNFALSYFLNATDRQLINTRNLGLTMILNVVLNIFLIKEFSVMGASIASSVSTVFLFTANLLAVSKVVAFKGKDWWPILKALLASGLMGCGLWYLHDLLPILVTIAVGILIYLGLMILFKNLSKADWLYIKGALRRK